MKAVKFEIDRSTWAFGDGYNTRLLYNGRLCCLGFYALACGVPTDTIINYPAYDDLPRAVGRELPGELVAVDEDEDKLTVTDLHDSLISANDRLSIPRVEREESITKLFAEIGVAVEFAGDYPA